MSMDRPFHIVVFGATGFTGRLAAEYLARNARAANVRWAIAGRNASKLAEVKRALEAIDPSCASVAVIEASANDPASLERMARDTRVVLTTVGPFAEHGEPLVAACVKAGADYVDITGEPEFVDAMIEKYDVAAKAAGVRIVNCCGFDSIPHDLGVLYTVRKLPRGGAIKIEGFVRSNGTFSGGTWHSAVGAMSRLRETRGKVRARPDCGDRKVRGIRPRIRFEKSLKAWVCPLPTIDPQIVLRSACAMDEYGPEFSYGHYAQIKSTAVLAGGLVGVGAVVALAQFAPTRDLLLKVKAQGDGPSPEQRAKSRFSVTFYGESGGTRIVTRVSGGDPGYDETSKMVAESALCLALDRDRLPGRAGVLTPAAAMGDPLLERLHAAGIRFEVVQDR